MTPTSEPAGLLRRNKGFRALVAAQFLGALNDNAFKILVTLMVADLVVRPDIGSRYVSLASALFVVPFILFSTYAGVVADRFSKRTVAVGCKLAEVGIAALGFFALYHQHLGFLMFVLFLMGLHSTFFGPAKYGMLPEILEPKDLSNGNGIIQLTTFLAIITGTVLGGLLLGWTKPDVHAASAVLITIAAMGAIASLGIARIPRACATASVDWNPLRKFYRDFREAAQDRPLYLCVIGSGYFWFLGAVLQIVLLLYGKNLMHASERLISLNLATLAIGIGLGSGIAGKISGEKIEFGLVPLGSIGMGLFSLDLAFAHASVPHVMADLFLLGFFGGFFIVPLNALLQQRSPKDGKGRMVAMANVVNFVGVLAASLVTWLLTDRLHLNPAQTFAVMAAATFGVTAYILWLLPAAFLRLIFWLLTHSLYRIRVIGRENFPLEGPALLVCNHLSYADALYIGASVARPVRFFVWRPIYEWRVLHWFFKLMRAIPISPSDGPKKFMASMEEARAALRNGEVVCIFAEGAVTRIAQTLGFKKGMEIIAKGVETPIVPVHLDRVWGSIFSFKFGKFIWKLPKRIPYPVTVSFGNPMPAVSRVHEVRQAVLDLGSVAFMHRQTDMLPLHRALIRQSKRMWGSKAVADSGGMSLTHGKFLTGAFLLARRFGRTFAGDDRVGVLLPPCVPAALVNVALPFAGKTPVNLNYTMSQELVERVIEKAAIRKVITSRKFMEAIKWEAQDRFVFLEDLPAPSMLSKALTWAALFAMPARLIEACLPSAARTTLDDLATILFTSGSSGVPKGVMLTHANIQSNVQGLLEVLQMDSDDAVIGVLPFFHSFGFTGTIWFPLLGGFSVVYHRSPLEPAVINRLIRDHRGTVLLATPTLLKMWMKKFRADDVKTLRFAVAGAEKLPEDIARDFQDQFGATVLEGYGCTELSPVACASVLNVKDRHEFQLGHKPGKVGRPLPGVSVRIVDPETFDPLLPGKAGLLLVKGPNVMKGYWDDPERTGQVMRDGWYVTGDIATIDEDGFIQITDRLSRFSKIGGEMVPHILIEERLTALAGRDQAQFCVTAVPDGRKGERLVVLCKDIEDLDGLLARLHASDLPKLWVPDRRSFHRVNEFPLLGSGKRDFQRMKSLALSLEAGEAALRT